jgi:EAL domain-containing protein (putative c-di-GMP-specific phosphodiesterase class I)
MHDPEQAARTMDELKNMGIALAIDDFGIGYSSLAFLKNFPVDSLKVDGSFVRGIPNNADDKAITAAIIALGHSLKLKVVVEGVETDEQAKFLRDQNCDEMQGFFFSKGLTEADFTALLEEQEKKLRRNPLTSLRKNLSAA